MNKREVVLEKLRTYPEFIGQSDDELMVKFDTYDAAEAVLDYDGMRAARRSMTTHEKSAQRYAHLLVTFGIRT